MTLKFASGVDSKELGNLDKNIAYAFTTKDAWGNEIISQYGVKVKADNQTERKLEEVTKTVDFKVSYNLDDLVNEKDNQLDNVVDYYYTVNNDELKNQRHI